MSCSIGIGLIAWIVILAITGVTGLITNPPMNAVAEVGDQARFSCTSDQSLQNWLFSRTREGIDTQKYQGIAVRCVVQTGFTTHYEVDRPGGSQNKCNLIVKAMTMQQAGVYSCGDLDNGPSAVLAVIDRDTSITVNSTDGIVEGDTVTMSYTVRYNTSTASPKTPTIQPVLIWTDSDGKTVTSSQSSEANSITSSISVTAELPNIPPYSCRLKYQINWPSSSAGLQFANNIPFSVFDPLNSSTIDVLSRPDNSDAAKDSDGVPTSRASGLSVGLFKRNNVIIILMVCIAVLLPIGSKGTSGV